MRPVCLPGTIVISMFSPMSRPQHFVQAFHHVIEVEHDGLHRLFAAEDEQLLRQPGGTLRRVPDLLGMFPQRLSGQART